VHKEELYITFLNSESKKTMKKNAENDRVEITKCLNTLIIKH
jgi:hypothetical protein